MTAPCSSNLRRRQQHCTTSRATALKIKTKKTSTATLPLLAMAASLLLPLAATANIFEVSPEGSPYSIVDALAEAGPGDTLSLADGIYDEPIVTVAGGAEGSPLLIEGGRGAVVNGAFGDLHRAVYVQHSWVTLQVRAVLLFVCPSIRGVSEENDLARCTCVW